MRVKRRIRSSPLPRLLLLLLLLLLLQPAAGGYPVGSETGFEGMDYLPEAVLFTTMPAAGRAAGSSVSMR